MAASEAVNTVERIKSNICVKLKFEQLLKHPLGKGDYSFLAPSQTRFQSKSLVAGVQGGKIMITENNPIKQIKILPSL